MKTLLITGVTGFLGSKILDSISNQNFKIFAIIRTKNEFLINKYPNVNFIVSSLEEIPNEFFISIKFDILIHFAWSNVSKVMLNTHISGELELQKSFLKKALDFGVKEMIISGSCFEYGKIEGGLDIDCRPLPNTLYGIAKNNLRIWMQDYAKNLNLDTSIVWLRIFYAYGSGQHERSLYSQLINAINNSQIEFNMSHGEQIRDFISVDEISKIVLEVLSNKHNDEFIIKNVCSGKGITVKNFVENILLEKNAKLKLNLGYYPVPDYEPTSFWGIK